MKRPDIDRGAEFDFGRTAADYARWRDIYPDELYERLIALGIGKKGQRILDLGSGPAILPLNLHRTGAQFTATDIAAEQLHRGEILARERGIHDITFRVCPAEDTGFPDSSFDAVTAIQCFHYFAQPQTADEIRRILRPNGILCKVMMEWLPYEDPIIMEMEQTVLLYNPLWSGGGFRAFNTDVPDWVQGRFILDHAEELNVTLTFTREAWLQRILTCRGVGASLSCEKIAAFEHAYRARLSQYPELLHLKHRIRIECYQSTKEV